MARSTFYDVSPSAARLTGSLRDIGYDFQTAVADLVDNSVAAGAERVDVTLEFEPNASYVLIADDGVGMTSSGLLEALRFGSRRDYEPNELGRFGLGLKTGTFSQCRRLTVVSRRAPDGSGVNVRTLDLDVVERFDQWAVLADESGPAIDRASRVLEDGGGTVVVWENLDRVLPERYAESGWGRRRIMNLQRKTADHLSMVFHRFLAGVGGREPVAMTVNGEKLLPWDPFARDEKHTRPLAEEILEVETPKGTSEVRFRGFVLPPRDRFSSSEAFDRLSGPLKWNRQQGLYIYRADRLVQYGGWCGLRSIDEHTKLARGLVEFDTDLDEAFQINVAKMRVILPPTLKQMLERPVHDLCMHADDAYRQAANGTDRATRTGRQTSGGVALREVGVALKAALLETSDDLGTFRTAAETLRSRHPELARVLDL